MFKFIRAEMTQKKPREASARKKESYLFYLTLYVTCVVYVQRLISIVT